MGPPFALHSSLFTLHFSYCSSPAHLARTEGDLVTAARADLMQLDDIAKGILDKDLVRIVAHQALDAPVPEAAPFQFLTRLLDVFHRQRHVRQGRVFFFAARHRRHASRAHQVDLRRLLALADIHPEAGNSGDVGPARIGLQAQDLGVELTSLLNFLWGGTNTDAMVMQLNDFDRHTEPSLLIAIFTWMYPQFPSRGESCIRPPLFPQGDHKDRPYTRDTGNCKLF